MDCGRSVSQRDHKYENNPKTAGFCDGGGRVQGLKKGLEELKVASSSQPGKKKGLQVYNLEELDSANNLSEFFLRTS